MSEFAKFIENLFSNTPEQIKPDAVLTREQLLEVYNPTDFMPITLKHLIELMVAADKHMDLADKFVMPQHKNDKEGLIKAIGEMRDWAKVTMEFHSAILKVDCDEGMWFNSIARCITIVNLQGMFGSAKRNQATYTAFAEQATGIDDCSCNSCKFRRGEAPLPSGKGLEGLLAALDEALEKKDGREH
ncbi:MAG: hypothetical protein COB09_18780 [Thalassobium sp.]|nr:MAG: hypothetical protein COB09_18780 [Thalassobium sp.]